MGNDSDYRIGESVVVEDGERPKFKGIIAGPNPKNTAEYEVLSDGKTWTVHWAYLKRAS